MNKKRTFILGSLLLLGFLIWYFFLKPYDYNVRFTVPASSGTVYNKVKDWVKFEGYATDTTSFILESKPYKQLTQKVEFITTEWLLDWNFEPKNDTLTIVKVGIRDKRFTLKNRLEIPFLETEFEKMVKYSFVKFKKRTLDFLNNQVRVTIKNDSLSPEIHLVYVKLKSLSKEKALNMMRNDYALRYYIDTVLHQPIKTPIIEVTHWDVATDSIIYNYGFPIDANDTLPESNQFFYKKIEAKPALRAMFNGNYMNSHHSWYQMYVKSVRENIPLDGSIIEVYRNNPYNGGNELEWETDVYMPLKK